MASKFCVIGLYNAKSDAKLTRSFFETQEEAAAHASRLCQSDYRKRGESKQLLVVEVKQVVEIGIAPVTVRDVTDADIAIVSDEEYYGEH